MRAIRVADEGPGARLVVDEVPDPVPGDGETIVEVRATAVNRADLHQAAGQYPPPPGESEILGLEMAGEVASTRERVFALLPGGGYAEKVAVPRAMLMPIPAGLSFEEAASIPEAFLTAHLNLFAEGALRSGGRALVHAAGSGVGTAAVQLVRRAGGVAIATVRSASKVPLLKSLGAALVVDVSSEDFAPAIERAFGRDAVNVVLDPVAGPYLAGNLRVLARTGRLVVLATMGGPKAELDFRVLMAKRLVLVGSTLRSRSRAEKAALTESFTREALPGFSDGSLRPVVDTVLPLERADEAHARMRDNANAGKIVLRVA